MEVLAIRYSDGSLNVLPDADLEDAEHNRSHDDDSVKAEIVRVRVEVLEVVAPWKPKTPQQAQAPCPHCAK